MIVVSNASPLINLARIGRLDLLERLYGRLVVPDAVWQEVVVDGDGQPGAAEIKAAGWIRVRTVEDRRLVLSVQRELDPGEAEAIALALEMDAALLLMDERLGRESARYLGVRCTGLVGLLVEAKRKGLIPAVKPLLARLRDIAGFRLSNALVLRVLQDEGEA